MLSCCIVQSIQRITSSRLQQQGSKKVRKCRFFVRISQISQILQIVDFLIKTFVRFLFSQSFALFLSFKEKTFYTRAVNRIHLIKLLRRDHRRRKLEISLE